MINFSFNIGWPWFKNTKSIWTGDYFYKACKITKHKTLELQFSKGGDSIIGGSFRWDARCDHAGVTIDFSLFRRFLYITFSDNRHWNDDEDRYVNYDNPAEVEKYW